MSHYYKDSILNTKQYLYYVNNGGNYGKHKNEQ